MHRFSAILLLAACVAAPKREDPEDGAQAGEHARKQAEAQRGEPRPQSERPLGHAGKATGESSRDTIEEYLRKYGYDAADFRAVPDRWRVGLPRWQRIGDTRGTDSPYEPGAATDPYAQNVWKGDYPILGQNVFFVFTAVSDTLLEARRLPTPSGVSTAEPRRQDFFGSGDQRFAATNLLLSFELFKGNTAFKPPDWLIRVTPVLNASYLDVDENFAVNLDPLEGTDRTDGHVGFQEAFIEKHLVDLSANYDFLSVTVGIQPFVADFRGLLFSDNNLGVRLTANLDNNRLQASVAAFYQLEKDTNSELNSLDTRDQVVVVANFFRQDFLFLGYTISGLVAYNRDNESTHFDDNRVPVRPPVLGDADPHRLDIFYAGLSGDGHIGRINITHEYFYAYGEDSRNPLAGRAVDVEAHMFFLEASVDFDWYRPRVSFLFASGDDDPMDGTARGFDAILDNPNFAGGLNSFWIRQNLRLLGVGLVHRSSAFPTLRSSKLEGQANFVNPGLLFLNAGIDAELTAELRASLNVSYLRFAETGSLEPFVNQNDIDGEIGWEANVGLIYRPKLTNNIQIASGLALFLPGEGFKDIYESDDELFSAFVQLTLVY